MLPVLPSFLRKLPHRAAWKPSFTVIDQAASPWQVQKIMENARGDVEIQSLYQACLEIQSLTAADDSIQNSWSCQAIRNIEQQIMSRLAFYQLGPMKWRELKQGRTRWEGDVFAWVILAFGLEAFVYLNQKNGPSASQVLADEFVPLLCSWFCSCFLKDLCLEKRVYATTKDQLSSARDMPPPGMKEDRQIGKAVTQG